MKQTLFMIALTLFGSGGAFLFGPFLGFAVYLTYAVLRPQFLWEWALPQGVQWSFFVAVATMAAVVLTGPRTPRPAPGRFPPAPLAFNRAHVLFFLFGVAVQCFERAAFDDRNAVAREFIFREQIAHFHFDEV